MVELAGGVEKTLDWDWPPLVDIDPVQLVAAITDAADTSIARAVPKVLLRLLLGALGVQDVDEVLADVTDEDGNWVDPDVSGAGAEVLRQFRRGEDPAEDL